MRKPKVIGEVVGLLDELPWGGVKIDVWVVKGLQHEDGDECVALACSDQMCIFLDTAMRPGLIQEWLGHELMHLFADHLEIKLKHDNIAILGHCVINCLSNYLDFTVLRESFEGMVNEHGSLS